VKVRLGLLLTTENHDGVYSTTPVCMRCMKIVMFLPKTALRGRWDLSFTHGQTEGWCE
jgi:hypothetical protein